MCNKIAGKKYDAWLHWCVGYACNLKCEYCINSGHTARLSTALLNSARRLAGLYNVSARFIIKRVNEEILNKRRRMGNRISETRSNTLRSKDHYRIDIAALMNTLNKSKKIFRIGFTSGEPFLVSNIIEACVSITRGHYISLITNLVSGDIKNFSQHIKPNRVVDFHASLHIKELERLKLVNKFIDNFQRLKDKGFNIYAQAVGYPPLAKEVQKYKQFFEKKGIEISFEAFVGSCNFENYPESYTNNELKQFGLDSSVRKIWNTHGKNCIAGYNFASISPQGDIFPCERIHTSLNGSHIYKKINFNNKMIVCPEIFCPCPFYLYDPYLFNKAITETKVFSTNKSCAH